MKLSSFTLGAVAGLSAMALAVPFAAQIVGAQTTSAPSGERSYPVPTQACALALAEQEGTYLSTVDTLIAAQKTAMQAHKDALTAAATIADDVQREEAIQQANDNLRAAMEAARKAQGDPKTQMDALKTACGDSGFRGFGPMMGGGMMGFGGRGMGMHDRGEGPGPKMNMLAEKLGMTKDELQAALDSGQTVQQIAESKGVTLPAGSGKGEGMMRGGRGRFGAPSNDTDDTTEQ
ncbi:MAG: hypothetical protein PHZ00_03490 [Candidatus Peribacteraceae bacterium]|nr:hypothetical protein [Candidatus Peribacteraceae bacterium]